MCFHFFDIKIEPIVEVVDAEFEKDIVSSFRCGVQK